MIGKCALCNSDKELKKSHIVPKFIGKWLKETSATGYLRQGASPDARHQDISKQYLLCGECELIFSKNEKLFSEKIFKPFQNGYTTFQYDSWLKEFIISVQWRILAVKKETATGLSDNFLRILDNTFEMWRAYLNNESKDTGLYTHHIYFFDENEIQNKKQYLPERPNMYLLRSIDCQVITNNVNNLSIYSKLPGILIWSQLYPEKIEGWPETIISDKGILSIPQECNVDRLWELIGSLINESRMGQISEAQLEKIIKSSTKNKEKTKNSRSYAALLADENLK
ncbi:hypothetical protein [Bacillus sp. Brlt_9]|uniref:hypothetical protein n=1 Tax=Bacillus sp. Brlt_9 TaxID=3110916 RepID=UPI003F7B6963